MEALRGGPGVGVGLKKGTQVSREKRVLVDDGFLLAKGSLENGFMGVKSR